MITEMIKSLQEIQEKFGEVDVKAYIIDGTENEYLLDITSIIVAEFEKDKLAACVVIEIKEDGK